jgi:hypothetical protein BBIF_0050
MTEKIKKFIKKGNYTKTKIVLLILISIIGAFILTSIARRGFIWDRIPILTVILFFAGSHFIFNIKELYNNIYKYRFYIAGIVLIYAVLMGYSGSSIGIYNDIIQPNNREIYYSPIFGDSRTIRTDEWAVNAPSFVSQCVDPNGNNYSYYHDSLRGTKTEMFSQLNQPILDILSIGKPFTLGALILGASRGYSFLWAASIIALLLVSFEFCMVISKNNKLASLLGMLLISFSASTQWWQCYNIFTWGMLAIVLFDKFMLTKKFSTKILCSIGIFISGISYIFYFYPTWQVPYGYIYLAVLIWVIIKNWKEYKINKKDILLIIAIILAIGAILGIYFVKSADALKLITGTDYPGKRFETGGKEIKTIFSYVYSIIFPYKIDTIGNPCELSSMISFYPIPMLIALIYLVRNIKTKKHFSFLILMLIISIVYSIFMVFGVNEMFAKITLLYMTPAGRLAVPLGFSQILLIVYMLGNFTKEDIILKNEIIKKAGTVLASISIMYIALKTDMNILQNHPMYIYICGLILIYGIYQIVNINEEKNKKRLIMLLMPVAILTGATVHPIQKGISVLTDKPVAQKTQEIVSQDKENNLWICDSTNFMTNNYLLASGAKIINSTNLYTNFDLYKTVLGEEESQKPEVRYVYNRYSHINMEITEDKNDIELVQQDSIKISLTSEKIRELGVKYILTTRDLDQFDTEDVKYQKIYDEDGMIIYHVEY